MRWKAREHGANSATWKSHTHHGRRNLSSGGEFPGTHVHRIMWLDLQRTLELFTLPPARDSMHLCIKLEQALLLLCSQGWLLYARALEFLHLGGVTPICGDKQDQNVVGTSYLYAAWFIFCTLKGLILCIDRVSMYKYFMGAMYNVSFHLKCTYLYFYICNLMVV